jgi:hypothetical protein
MLDHQSHIFSVGHQGVNPIYLLIMVRSFLNPDNLIPMYLSGRNQAVDPQRLFHHLAIGLHLFALVTNTETAVE